MLFYDTVIVFQRLSIFIKCSLDKPDVDYCLVPDSDEFRHCSVWVERQFLISLSRRPQSSRNAKCLLPRRRAQPIFWSAAPMLPEPQRQQQSTYGNAWFDIVSFYFAEMSICMFPPLPPLSATRHHCNPWGVKCDPGLLPLLLKKERALY